MLINNKKILLLWDYLSDEISFKCVYDGVFFGHHFDGINMVIVSNVPI